jgi:hypothetical protein
MITRAKQRQRVMSLHSLYRDGIFTLEVLIKNLITLQTLQPCLEDETKDAPINEQTKLILSQEEESDYKITENGVPIINTKKAIKNG